MSKIKKFIASLYLVICLYAGTFIFLQLFKTLNDPHLKVKNGGPPKVDIFIAVISAPLRLDRRMAIRETYASTVDQFSIGFRFFTDSVGLDEKLIQDLVRERDFFSDIELIPTKAGYWFAHRFLFALFWALKHYEFLFFLRADDDYFLCLNNLASDLQYRKQEQLLYWGNLRCLPRIVMVDEGFVIVGKDLAQEFVKRNHSLYCCPFGDQMIAMWINDLEGLGYNVTYFADNERVIHYRSSLKTAHSHTCRDVLAIHQAYPKYMKYYWNLTKDTWFVSNNFKRVQRLEYHEYCRLPKIMDWKVFGAFYRKEPKPCWDPGVYWPALNKSKMHAGRESEE